MARATALVADTDPRVADHASAHTLAAGLLSHMSPTRAALFERELRAALPPPGTPEDTSSATLEELELRNVLRVFASWRRLAQRCLSASLLERQLGVSRQRLQQLRGERKLLGLRLPLRRELYYPVWQFTAAGVPHPLLPRLLHAAEEAHLAPLELDAMMTSTAAGDGVAPAELLRRGDTEQVFAIVGAALSGAA
ncbi:MAG TPA: hypothetical protein VIU62_10385 [Chloroflexota bacterium]|jgi:hypothetical protein